MQRIALGRVFIRPDESLSIEKILFFSMIFSILVLLLGYLLFTIRHPVTSKASGVSATYVVSKETANFISPAMLEVHIANNGSVFVRGATVSSITNGDLGISVVWGSTDFSWIVKTTAVTKFINSKGKKQTLADLKIGDIVNVTGSLLSNSDQLIVSADYIRIN